MTQSKNDIAALEMARELGVKWDTAWLIKQKLMETMCLRNRNYKLKGDVQLMTPIWAVKSRASAGAERQTRSLSSSPCRRARISLSITQLRCVAGFTNSEIKAYAAASIEAGSPVATDGLACFAALTSAGMMHRPIVTGGSRPTNRN